MNPLRFMLIACAGLFGCLPSPGGLDTADPASRAQLLTAPDTLKDPSTIPARIEMLNSDDALVRMLAIRSLERMTGLTHGYNHAAPLAERLAAIDRWKKWYEAHDARASAPREEPSP